MSVEAYKTRAIISGNVIEIYKYKDTIFRGFEANRSGSAGENDFYDSEGNKVVIDPETGEMTNKSLTSRARSNIRARNNIRRLALANFSNKSKFLTLTFKENITALDEANKLFKAFVRKLKKEQADFKYLAVIEFQKRGAIHYHILCNLKYIRAKRLAELWGNGFIKINRITHVDNIGAYVVKYMTKEDADERLTGKKMYQRSRGLDEPREIVGKEADYILSKLEKERKKIAYSSSYENKLTGNKIDYLEFNLTRK